MFANRFVQSMRVSSIKLIGSLLLRRECCTFTNGEYVKSGLAELEKWIVNATEEVFLSFSITLSLAKNEFWF